MSLTVKEYSEQYTVGKKHVSPLTIRRRIWRGLLPSNHVAKKIGSGKGTYVIDILPEYVPGKNPIPI